MAFDPLAQVQLGRFIADYEDWILFTVLLFIFWSVVGIALRKRFEEGRHLRTLVTSISLLMAVGTYFSVYRGWLHLSLQGLGFFGVGILFVAIFFVIFGMMKSYGVKSTNAVPFGYLLFYVAVHAISPNISDNIAEIFPLLNLVMAIFFIASIVKVVSAFFKSVKQNPLEKAKDFMKAKFTTADSVEVDREIKEDKKEIKLLKHKTFGLTKRELNTVDDIEEEIGRMIRTLKKHGVSLGDDDKRGLTESIRKIQKNEQILWNSLELLEKHETAYNGKHKKDIRELSQRLKKSEDPVQQKAIREELTYQKRMQQVLAYLEKYQGPISKLIKSFPRFLALAIDRIRNHNIPDAITNLEHAHKNLYDLKHFYQMQGSLEKYLIKMDHRLIRGLKKEKKAA